MLLGATMLALAAVAADYERIELRSGTAVVGEVLKERADEIVVDLGSDVIVIPTADVVRRSSGDSPVKAMSVASHRYGDSGHLFATADLPPAPIKDLVKRFGEAVVVVKTPSGTGSGFFIDDDGHCVTNYHVVEKESRITVDIFQKSGQSFTEKSIGDVEIVALNPFFDLALIKVPTRKDIVFKHVFLGFSDELRPGEEVFVIGAPLGLSRTVTDGTISNVHRSFSGQVYLQTNAQINPGNSGGPLFNTRGQVIGVINMKVPLGEGLGFAIPVNYLKDFLRHREAFSFNKDQPNTGYRYLDPPRRRRFEKPASK
ncbi:Putative serine protease HhoB precursor [Planctomycetes bacterium Pan216]|uniref:Serine protease HhoB n=1 Tax=Kolteria novifilia TaxID=2527975 RepID=A0A518BD10_9BACT|nr:Putative serine protease HhoB precursor [Planctomycetes bacterium Pan216]